MNLHIDHEMAIDLLEQAVASRGEDYIYRPPTTVGPVCVYTHKGEPSCGVGVALNLAGVPVETLALMDTLHNTAITQDNNARTAETILITLRSASLRERSSNSLV